MKYEILTRKLESLTEIHVTMTKETWTKNYSSSVLRVRGIDNSDKARIDPQFQHVHKENVITAHPIHEGEYIILCKSMCNQLFTSK